MHETWARIVALRLRTGISAWLLLSLAAVILVNLAANIVAYDRLGVIRSNSERSRDSYEAMLRLQDLLGTVVSQYSALDRFLASGESASLDPFRTTGKAAFDKALEALTAQRPNDLEYRQRLKSIGQLLNDWRAVAERHIKDQLSTTREEPQEKLDRLLKAIDTMFEAERAQIIARTETQSGAFGVASIVSIAGPGAALLVGLFVSLWLIRGITVPIRHLTGAMEKVADGRLDTTIPATNRSDEIGKMARTLEVFRDGLLERKLRAKAEAEQVARLARQEHLASHVVRFEGSVQQLLDVVNVRIDQMHAVSKTLAQVAGETTSCTANALASSHQVNGHVAQVSSAAEELATSISSIAQRVIALNDTAAKAAETTAETNKQVSVLSVASEKIGDVVELINGIAKQTNLLALNATIEASRAGAAGKGFAVVAAEVKSLSDRTARATADIAKQVSAIQASTSETVLAIEQVTRMLTEINSVTAGISAAMTEQETTTVAISRSMQETSTGTQDVQRDLSIVSDAASRTSAAAVDTETASLDVARQAAELKAVINGFLKEVTG